MSEQEEIDPVEVFGKEFIEAYTKMILEASFCEITGEQLPYSEKIDSLKIKQPTKKRGKRRP